MFWDLEGDLQESLEHNSATDSNRCPQIHIDPLSSPSTLIGQPPYIPIPLPEIPMDLRRYPETPYRFQCSPLDNYRYLKIP